MTDKEILLKAIEQAEKNGYNSEEGVSLIDLTKNTFREGEVTGLHIDPDYLEKYVLIPYIIFDHDFAKAFWGEKKIDTLDWYPWIYTTIETWRYHLGTMAMTNKPLKYLEKFL